MIIKRKGGKGTGIEVTCGIANGRECGQTHTVEMWFNIYLVETRLL